jgi:hypothetical protein
MPRCAAGWPDGAAPPLPQSPSARQARR